MKEGSRGPVAVVGDGAEDRGGALAQAPSGRSVPGHPRYDSGVTRARDSGLSRLVFRAEDWDTVHPRALTQ